MELEQGRVLRLERAAGVVIGCKRGALWITEEGDPNDHLVAAGGRHHVRERGLVVAEALHDSAVWVCRPVPVRAEPLLGGVALGRAHRRDGVVRSAMRLETYRQWLARAHVADPHRPAEEVSP